MLASHLGRPKGKPNAEMSLQPVAARLASCLARRSALRRIASVPKLSAQWLRPLARVVLLENLRFHPEEEKTTRGSRHRWRRWRVYVNDAFGAAHRAHASVEAMVRLYNEAARDS